MQMARAIGYSNTQGVASAKYAMALGRYGAAVENSVTIGGYKATADLNGKMHYGICQQNGQESLNLD